MRASIIVAIAVSLLHCSSPTSHESETENAVPLTKADSNLLIAQQNFQQYSSEDNFIWLGRRLAYLNRFDDAIDTYTRGLSRYPESYKLHRHRGHRYISTRNFDRAIDDLKLAAELMNGKPIEIEPDGIPNKLNIPLSSTQFNVWYHLGLAYYLKGDYANAVPAYEKCLEVSTNDDLLIATLDWYYMTLRRMGDPSRANNLLRRVDDNMTIIENDSYYKRLRMYQGKIPPDSLLTLNSSGENFDLTLATQGYGVGNWYLYNKDSSRALQIFQKVISGKSKTAFGFIAAEADVIKLFN